MKSRTRDEDAVPCERCLAVRYEDCVCYSAEAHDDGCPSLVVTARVTSRKTVEVRYGLGSGPCTCSRPAIYQAELLETTRVWKAASA